MAVFTTTARGATFGRAETSSPVAIKPPSGRVYIWVDADIGKDTNDGRSYGTPLKTVAAAVAALPNGGPIGLAPSVSTYSITSSLNLSGHSIQTVGRAPGGNDGLAQLEHNFNGDMIVCGANGAFLRNLLLYQDSVVTGRTGAALTGTSSVSNGGEIVGENLIFSGNDGWERDLILDGTAWVGFGIRKCVFTNCQFFGCRTASETIKITRGVHCKFLGGFIDPAPTAVSQGIKIFDSGSTDVQFVGFRLDGDFYTEAAGDLLYAGMITGNVTCTAISANNRFVARVGGTVSDSGSANYVTSAWQAASSLLANSWVDAGAGNIASGYRRNGATVEMRGKIASGTVAASTTLLTLPAGFRPAATANFLVYAANQAGALTPAWITVNSAGAVVLQTSLAGTGTSQAISFDQIAFSTLA